MTPDNQSLAMISGLLVLATVGAAFVAKALRRSRPHRFQDDAAHVLALKIAGEEEARDRLQRAIAEQKRRKRSTRSLRLQLFETERRLEAFTGANEA